MASIAVRVKDGNTRRVEAESESGSWISGWTAEFIREEQMKDLIICKILRMKETSNDRIEWKEPKHQGLLVSVETASHKGWGFVQVVRR